MKWIDSRFDRRRWLGGAAAVGLGLAAGPALGLAKTPRQTTGPFYPYDHALETDADLVQVGGRGTLARGVIAHLGGVVKDHRGRAVPGAVVEIWQCDANGRYHHPRDRRDAPLDENFQGYGRSRTGADGGYRFRTIQPVAYPGRAPHIHFTIRGPGFEPLVTQMYVKGAPQPGPRPGAPREHRGAVRAASRTARTAGRAIRHRPARVRRLRTTSGPAAPPRSEPEDFHGCHVVAALQVLV